MVKHTQTIRPIANELFECVWPFCRIGIESVNLKYDWSYNEFWNTIPSHLVKR